jgi:hypothetical protein
MRGSSRGGKRGACPRGASDTDAGHLSRTGFGGSALTVGACGSNRRADKMAREPRASITSGVVDAVNPATVLSSSAMRPLRLDYPMRRQKRLGSKYIRALWRRRREGTGSPEPPHSPHGLHSSNWPAFSQLLTSRLAPKEAAELELKALGLERPTEPQEMGLFDPDAEAEDEARAEIDLEEPWASPSQGSLPRMRELVHLPPPTGRPGPRESLFVPSRGATGVPAASGFARLIAFIMGCDARHPHVPATQALDEQAAALVPSQTISPI